MSEPESQTWRLLDDGITDPFLHFGVEEALLRLCDEKASPPTLRLRRVEPSVFIGVYQDAAEDVDIAYCRRRRIKLVRRPNPGGAVYQDDGSFCYSAFFNTSFLLDRLGLGKPEDFYTVFGRAVIETCARYGVKARLSPVNDVTVGGRKIYGSAQTSLYETFCHSGTFLVDTDLSTMAGALRPSRLKFSDKNFTSVKERVINLAEAAGRSIDPGEVCRELASQLAEVLQIRLIPGSLSAREMAVAEQLAATKYGLREWTFGKQAFPESARLAVKAASGVLSLGITRQGETITEVSVKGDFLLPDQRRLEDLLAKMRNKTVPAAVTLIDTSGLPEDLRRAMHEIVSSWRDN
jgi:lipoate-protein ligase A